MNEYQKSLMDAPSVESDLCVICGCPATNQHHVVPKSAGGTNGPTISVCGNGNMSGCHKLLHDHILHVTWSTVLGWEYLFTDKPMKEDKALRLKDWRPFPVWT